MAKVNVRALYNTCSLLVEQAEKAVNAGKPVDPSIIEGLKQAYEEIIKYEKIYLIQCEDRFWGNVLMQLDICFDFKQRGPTDLDIKAEPVKLKINPLFCKDKIFAEFTGFIMAEMMKMVYEHPIEYSKINSEKDKTKHKNLESASDASVASIIKSDIRLSIENDSRTSTGCRLPDDYYTQTKLSEECGVRVKDKMDLKYYYDILNKCRKNSPVDPPQDGVGVGMSGDSNGVATGNNNEGHPVHQWENADSDEAKEKIISIVSEAYNSLTDRQRGFLPGGVASQIQKLMAPPKINWKQILRKMVGSIPVPYRKTRMRLNRRQPFRGDLCGQLPKRTVNIVCAFDTSGSMSDEDLKYCMNEVFNIVKVYEGFNITVVECDSQVQRVYTARNMSDLKLDMKGRGGTSFLPVIDYINGEGDFKNNTKYPNAGKYKDALMVYFTDGYGDFEIPKPKTYRNLWVVLHDEKCLSLKEPYGDVRALEEDDDFRKMKGF